MIQIRTLTSLSVLALCGLLYLAVPASTSSAQDEPDGPDADLQAQVERLEKQAEDLQKQVEALQKQVAELERRLGAIDEVPRLPEDGEEVSPGARPFKFNDQTYYLVPLAEDQRQVQNAPTPDSQKESR